MTTYQELWAIEQIKRAEFIRYWMERGVRFSAAQTVHLDLDVKLVREALLDVAPNFFPEQK